MIRLLLVTFFLEVGFVLILVPWSAYWDRNYFAESLPHIHSLITNNFIRGAISGLGIINIVVGIIELASFFVARDRAVGHGERDEDAALPVAPARQSEE